MSSWLWRLVVIFAKAQRGWFRLCRTVGIRVEQGGIEIEIWGYECNGFCANTLVTLLYGWMPGDVSCRSRLFAVASAYCGDFLDSDSMRSLQQSP